MLLSSDHTAVLVIDMQNDFAHEEGALFSPASADVIPNIVELVESARNAGADIIYTQDLHSEEQFDDAHYYDEFNQWGEHVVEGSWGAELVDDLDVRENDYIVEKHTYDAFYETGLDDYLRRNNIHDIVVCGTLANVCVLHTAGSAGLRDYRPVLVEDCVGYIEESHRDYALEHADWLFGEVCTSNDIGFVEENEEE